MPGLSLYSHSMWAGEGKLLLPAQSEQTQQRVNGKLSAERIRAARQNNKTIATETVPGEAIKGGLGASSREKDMMQCDPELICLEMRMGLG